MNKVIITIIVILVILVAVYYGWQLNKGAYMSPMNNPGSITTSNILDLSNKGLTSVPSTVFNQTNLEELNLSNNLLTGAIPSQIGNLKNLKILNLSNNKMTGLPAEIGQLTNLQVLDVSNNQLTGLPNELANLKNLKTFNLSGNQYSQQDLNVILQGLPATVNVITGVTNQTQTVNIQNFAFNPQTLTVSAGTTVVWMNNDTTTHKIKSNTFNSNNLNPGDSFQFKFDTPGTYNYSCAIHPFMTGKIIVQ